MLIKFGILMKKYNMKIKGILHIGAHMCEEMKAYNDNGIMENQIIWIEANPNIVKKLKKYKNYRVINAIISDKDNKTVKFNIANNGQSSSILELGLHKKYHPTVHYIDSFQGKTKTIKTIYKDNNIPTNFANFLNIDIQGAELLALKGMGDLLNNFDYLYLEINEAEVYKGCGLVTEIDKYVNKYGFKRVETKMTPSKWGDSFYKKCNLKI